MSDTWASRLMSFHELTATQLSSMAGVTEAQVSRWIAGEEEPSEELRTQLELSVLRLKSHRKQPFEDALRTQRDQQRSGVFGFGGAITDGRSVVVPARKK